MHKVVSPLVKEDGTLCLSVLENIDYIQIGASMVGFETSDGVIWRTNILPLICDRSYMPTRGGSTYYVAPARVNRADIDDVAVIATYNNVTNSYDYTYAIDEGIHIDLHTEVLLVGKLVPDDLGACKNTTYLAAQLETAKGTIMINAPIEYFSTEQGILDGPEYWPLNTHFPIQDLNFCGR